jgi:hypothetical protein
MPVLPASPGAGADDFVPDGDVVRGYTGFLAGFARSLVSCHELFDGGRQLSPPFAGALEQFRRTSCRELQAIAASVGVSVNDSVDEVVTKLLDKFSGGFVRLDVPSGDERARVFDFERWMSASIQSGHTLPPWSEWQVHEPSIAIVHAYREEGELLPFNVPLSVPGGSGSGYVLRACLIQESYEVKVFVWARSSWCLSRRERIVPVGEGELQREVCCRKGVRTFFLYGKSQSPATRQWAPRGLSRAEQFPLLHYLNSCYISTVLLTMYMVIPIRAFACRPQPYCPAPVARLGRVFEEMRRGRARANAELHRELGFGDGNPWLVSRDPWEAWEHVLNPGLPRNYPAHLQGYTGPLSCLAASVLNLRQFTRIVAVDELGVRTVQEPASELVSHIVLTLPEDGSAVDLDQLLRNHRTSGEEGNVYDVPGFVGIELMRSATNGLTGADFRDVRLDNLVAIGVEYDLDRLIGRGPGEDKFALRDEPSGDMFDVVGFWLHEAGIWLPEEGFVETSGHFKPLLLFEDHWVLSDDVRGVPEVICSGGDRGEVETMFAAKGQEICTVFLRRRSQQHLWGNREISLFCSAGDPEVFGES